MNTIKSKVFEYKTIVCGTSLSLEKELNKYGEKGWDAISVSVNKFANGKQSITAFLKREA